MSNDASKAFKLRKQWDNGKGEISPEDAAWLTEYEGRPGVKRVFTADPEKPLPVENEMESPAAEDGLPSLEFETEAPPPPPKAKKRGRKKKADAPPPPPPKGKRQRRRPSDFRSKEEYAGAKMDRETVCVQLAQTYCALIHALGVKTKEMGGFAIPEEVIQKIIYPAAIACADDWMPETQAAPELVVVGSGAVQGAAYLMAKRKGRVIAPEDGEPIPDEPAGDVKDHSEREPERNPEAGIVNPGVQLL